ncbi:ATP-binding protein [uncultured Xylophilus sp.]|uniref:sensor histidine kinase n=1 Tax=uncultured Xylophilus sp. TaxID=296832 RepID=UPI0025FF139A|nr:ATP-binding protein [uncultured Xylophilus sp.]
MFPSRFALTARNRLTLLRIAMITLACLAAFWSYRWAEARAFERLDDAAARQLDLYASVLENELARYDYLPRLLQIDGDVLATLTQPEDEALKAVANRKLARFAAMSGISVAFVVDGAGFVLAGSDWYRPGTLVGKRLSLDSPTREDGDSARTSPLTEGIWLPGDVGVASDHCFSQSVAIADQMVGRAVVCISLDPLEATWTGLAFPAESEKPFVVNARGRVVISSVAAWKGQKLTSTASSAQPRGAVFEGADGSGEEVVFRDPLSHGGQLIRWKKPGTGQRLAVLNRLPVPKYGWHMMLVSDASEVARSARSAAWIAVALSISSSVLLMYLIQRRRVAAQKVAARAQLEYAYAELERTVQLRTAELLQAGKMAILGQLSTGISHELGQPLMALRALTSNTRLLLERDRVAEATANIDSISDMVERMGRITSQLKSFARKTAGDPADIALNPTIDAARSLMQVRLREEKVHLRVNTPARAMVRCDANRLEQVLVNLLANAMDAVRGREQPCVEIRAQEAAGRLVITVTDNGPGIPEELQRRLFEPFFTTKPAGEGLGLGLVISASIVREFGGELRTVDVPVGAAFAFDLALASAAAQLSFS